MDLLRGPSPENHWLCKSCGFRIPCAPGEEGPRHCPRCYDKRGDVSELKKIDAEA